MTAQTPLVNVLYGTVTGNAEEIARRIHALLPEKGLRQGLLRCLADYADVPAFADPGAHAADAYNVVVVSTTGDGDPPDTIRPFMKLLRSKDKARLVGLSFAVLGLGDTNYENFCKTGKRVDAGLAKLGARRFMARGDADDGVGLELIVEPWIARLWTTLRDLSPSADTDTDAVPPPSPSPTSTVEEVVRRVTAQSLGFDEKKLPPIPALKFTTETLSPEDTAAAKKDDDCVSIHPSYDPAVSRVASVTGARLLTAADAEKTVWHIELRCNGGGTGGGTGNVKADTKADAEADTEADAEVGSYRPGDAFGVVVHNDAGEVSRFLAATRSDEKQVIRVADQSGKVVMEESVGRVVRERLDLRAIPSKTLLRVLSEHTVDEGERRVLLQLSSRAGRLEYTKRISSKGMTVVQLLETVAPSCAAPLGVYVDLLPAVPLRWYSAASSPLLDGPDALHFAFSVVPDGLATNALAARCAAFLAGEKASPVILLPRDGSGSNSHFHPPPNLGTPYAMIGPGTGVAPFRGFLRERRVLLQQQPEEVEQQSKQPGDTLLFFGCRHEQQDYLYRDDLEQLVDDRTLSALHTAFSRDQDHKVYVQHRLTDHAPAVADLLRAGGMIFVCGDGGGMATDVHNALTKIVSDHLCDGDETAGKDLMKKLAAEHRYVRDIWYFG